MSAKHAVLGLVIERPGYGYQLAHRLQERCGAWGWEKSGVYGALDSLRSEKNIRSTRMKGSGASGRSAPRSIYEPTEKGQAFFRDWMRESSPPSPLRQELELKMLFSGPEYLPYLIEQTRAQEQACLDALGALKTHRELATGPPRAWRDVAIVLQRNAEIKMLEVRIEWLQDARRAMRDMFGRPGDR